MDIKESFFSNGNKNVNHFRIILTDNILDLCEENYKTFLKYTSFK